MADFLKSGIIVGGAGDVALQVLNKIGVGNSGLKSYFDNQSALGSVARASLLTGFWSFVYGETVKPDIKTFLVFSAGLDLFYRKYHSQLGFSDLDDYYSMSSVPATIVYNMCAGFLVFNGRKYF